MVALDLRIDAVMKIRGRSLVCAFFTTDDGVYCVRRTSDGRKKSKILNHDKNVFIGPIKLLRSLSICTRLAWSYLSMLIPCSMPSSVLFRRMHIRS